MDSSADTTGVLIRRWPCEDRATQGEWHMEMEEQIEVTLPQPGAVRR